MPIKIVLADNQALFRKGLQLLIEQETDMEVVGQACSGQEAIECLVARSPDVVVLDITLSDMNGIETTRQIAAKFPHIKVVALTTHADQRVVQEMLQAGATAYLLKDSAPEDIIHSIRTVMGGKVYLSDAITGVVVSEYVKVLSDAEESDNKPEKEAEDLTLLWTKLHRAQLTRDLIPRTKIANKIDDLRRRPFTLVSAPAGYGKSILASFWLKAWNGPWGWVSLDEDDSDLHVFMTYLLAAIQSVQGAGLSEACARTQSLLQTQGPLSAEVTCRHLLNDLYEIKTPFILVLDDYHKISDPDVNELVSGLMKHPSRNMHLILLTRRDPPLPIGKLRGRDQINEFGIFQLKFTVQETILFLKQNLGLSIDEATANEIHGRLEGGAAGMHLLSDSMANRKDAKHLVEGLQGSFSSIVEYLLAEVLSRQPAEMARRMVETALTNRFCASLCNAMHGQKVGSVISGQDNDAIDGQTFIEHLKTNNLFLISLDTESRWFRYHHLFQDLLMAQVDKFYSPKEISDRHNLASEWFAEHGFINEAIRHAMAASDVARAVHLIKLHRQTMLNKDRWYIFEKWLTRIPESEIEQHPELLLARVWTCYYQNKNVAIPPILAAVEALLGNQPEEQPLYGEIYLFKAVFSFWQGDVTNSLKYIEKALERIPETQAMVRGFAEIYLGLAGHMNGRTKTVVEVLSDLLDHSSLEAPRKVRVMIALVWVHLLSADLAAASIRNRQLIDTASKNKLAPFISWGSYNQGIIHFCRNELDLAIHHFNRAAETGYLILKRTNIDCLAGLALAHQAKQQADNADQMIERLFELINSLNDPALLEIALTCKKRLLLMRGESMHERHLTGPGQGPDMQPIVFYIEIPAITDCRILMAKGSNVDLKEAEKRLASLLQLNRTHHNTFRTIELMALQSQVVYRQGRLDEALTLLDQAVQLAEPGKWVQPFIELGPSMAELLSRLNRQKGVGNYIDRILTFFSSREIAIEPEPADDPAASIDQQLSPLPPAQPLVEPLTNRELDVLNLIAQRLQTKEIAEELCISPTTVNTHLQNIYQKLQVNKRQQAVEKATELGIL